MTPSNEPNPVEIDLAIAHLESDPDTEWVLLTRRPIKEGATFGLYHRASLKNSQQLIAYALTQLGKTE